MATVSVMVEEPASVTDAKRMRLRYAGTCARCGTSLAAGTTADYDRASKTVVCVACLPARLQLWSFSGATTHGRNGC
jgi:hypothetical protein